MDNQLQTIVQESGLETTKAEYILKQFQGCFEFASLWETKAKTIKVNDASQTADMKMARIGRLELREKRIEIEKVRKAMKEQSLREGKAIDGIANVLKGLIIPIEEYLDKQEHFIENQEKARLEAERIERERKEEEERIAKEKAEAEERERIRLENERLKKEVEEREAELQRKEKEKEEALRKQREAAEAEQRRKDEEAQRKLEAERAEREKAEAELRAKQEAEERTKREEATRIEQEKLASDEDKLIKLADTLKAISFPEVQSESANILIQRARVLLKEAITTLVGG